MDTPAIYDNFTASRTSGPPDISPPSLVPDGCTSTRRHQLPLQLARPVLILLVLSVIGFSISVRCLIQNPATEKCRMEVQENRHETTEIPVLLKCAEGWHTLRDKCLFFSQTLKPWSESLADCYTKESMLLMVQDQEELRLISNFSKREERLFWIGLNYALSEKIWKWINGSILNSDMLKLSGKSEENSCALISQEKVISDDCHADNYWICQKKAKTCLKSSAS